MRQKRRRVEKPKQRRSLSLRIEQLGAQGDGIAQSADGPVYVPRTVPGDEIEAEVIGQKADSFTLLKSGPDRREAPCPHFARCGGCALQHVSVEAYRAHKRAVLTNTFAQAGQDLPKIEEIWGEEASRRRTTLKARGRKKGAILGYQKAGSHELTPIDECLVLTANLQAALPELRKLASTILEPGEEAGVRVTEYENGLDISITIDPALYEKRRLVLLQALGAAAFELDAARITVNNEPALRARDPLTRFGDIAVRPPHDAFLQPSVHGEAVLRNLVLQSRPERESGRAVDLFAGCGTFSLPLLQYFDVIAYESEQAQVLALEQAARANTLPGIKAIRRDLFREPLGEIELRKIDYAVLNPPRAGARTQSEELAKSNVQAITYISCSPATLARDTKILTEGGYSLTSMTLLDQFVYSAHSECIATFRKESDPE